MSILERREQFEREMVQERKLGYPSFKRGIAEELTRIYSVDPDEALFRAFSLKVHKHIMNDIIWAQHMGPDYWAEVIYENIKNDKSEK